MCTSRDTGLRVRVYPTIRGTPELYASICSLLDLCYHSFDFPPMPSSCASSQVLIPCTSLSIWAILFPACTHTLTLSRPGGTVGYTIGLATTPRCCSHAAILRGCDVRSSNIGVVGSGGGSVINALAGRVARRRWACEMLSWRTDCSCRWV